MQITICSLLLRFYSTPTRLFYAQFIVFWISLLLECYSNSFSIISYFHTFLHSAFLLVKIIWAFSLHRRLVRVWCAVGLHVFTFGFFYTLLAAKTHARISRLLKGKKCENSRTHMEHFYHPAKKHFHHKSQFSEQLFLHFPLMILVKFLFCCFNITQIHQIYSILCLFIVFSSLFSWKRVIKVCTCQRYGENWEIGNTSFSQEQKFYHDFFFSLFSSLAFATSWVTMMNDFIVEFFSIMYQSWKLGGEKVHHLSFSYNLIGFWFVEKCVVKNFIWELSNNRKIYYCVFCN